MKAVEQKQVTAAPLLDERHRLHLNSSLTEQLDRLSRNENTTLHTTILAAIETLLYRYTESTAIVVGFPTAMGEQTTAASGEHEGHARPVYLDLASDLSFPDLLERTHAIVERASQHQDRLSSDLIVALRLDRGMTNTWPHRVMVEFGPDPCDTRKSSEFRVADFGSEAGFTPYDLRLGVAETPEGLRLWFDGDGDLLDADAISRMAGHLRTLLEGISADRQQSLSKLPLLTEPERRQLLVEWNPKLEESATGLFRHQLFESQVDRTPDALAVVYPEPSLNDHQEEIVDSVRNDQALRTLTYRELDLRANQLANHLIQLGVGPEVCVGVSMETSPELIIAVLAVCKAGGACVPLDRSFPSDRLAYIIDDADVAVILTLGRFSEQLPHRDLPVVRLDVDWERFLSGQSQERPFNRLVNENLATVFYTSGSTGAPKAVMSTHRKLDPRQVASGFNTDDRHLLKASIGFTPLQMEVFLPLTTGGRIVVAPPEIRLDSRRLIQFIAEHQITVTNFVPSMLRQVLHTPGLEHCRCLRHVVCFGEPLPVDLRQTFFAQLDAILDVHYGTTEATSATTLRMTRADHRQTDTIGRRSEFRNIYILDAHHQPVPCGIPGELYVGGPLARGYLSRPDLSAERFVPDPFSRSGGRRLYRTGDLARYLPDGSIQFLGRFDDQVKVRGYRVELGEVAAILGQHPDIDSAVVVVRKDGIGTHQLIAYLACPRKPAPDTVQIRRYLQIRLPSFMIPARFVIMKSLPLGQNGKVDRHALPEPDEWLLPSTVDFVAPRTEDEKEIARIWCDVLDVPRVGVDDDFFDLGGNSLLAIKMFADIETRLGCRLPLQTLLKTPTIAALAKHTSSGRESENMQHWSPLVPLRRTGTKKPLFFISPGAVLFLHVLANHLPSDQPVYGLQAPGLDWDDQQPLSRVEELAALHIAAIRDVQPEGPYLFCGRCFGGHVALEMAQQLAASGERVDDLIILDSSAPIRTGTPLPQSRPGFSIDRVRRAANYARKGELTSVLRKKLYKRSIKFVTAVRNAWLDRYADPQVRRMRRVESANWEAHTYYRAAPYAGRITLIRSSEFASTDSKDFHLEWSALALGGFEIHEIPGTHMGILQEPQVVNLAKTIEACIVEHART